MNARNLVALSFAVESLEARLQLSGHRLSDINGLPDLTPYQPTNWSDKIVVSTRPGDRSGSAALYDNQGMYLAWSVINTGNRGTNGYFDTALYVDGAFKTRWYNWSMGAGSSTSASNYYLPALPAGTHTITIVADASNYVAESDETNNSYTKTITVLAGPKPDLAPFQPAGWSDSVVVSSRTGDRTGGTLYDNQSLYVNWGVGNNGGSAANASFYVSLFVDGVYRTRWNVQGMSAGGSAWATDYRLGTLAAGTHTIRIVADSGNNIAESDETNNEYSKTITVQSAARVDLIPYQPAGWSNKIVVATQTGSHTTASAISDNQNVYLSWAAMNAGGAAAGGFYTSLYIDGAYKTQWYTQSLAAGASTSISDYGLGTLAAGSHTIRIVVDSGNAIAEANESNNEYSTTITVSSSGGGGGGGGTTTDWFSQNLLDPAIVSLARQLDADQSLSRTDMMQILRAGESGGSVSANELHDFRMLVTNATKLGMPDYVRVLSDHVVNANPANAHFQQQALGNLAANSTSTQLENLIAKWFLGADHPDAVTNIGSSTYATAAGSLFNTGPAYTDIRQGELGDCYFVASLAETALRSPSAITSMFIDNGDGTFAVRFFNGSKAEYVTVDRQLPVDSSGRLIFAGMGSRAADASNPLWVALAEKAFVQLNEEGWTGEDGTNTYYGVTGGWPGVSMAQITGRSAGNYYSLDYTTFTNSLNAGKAICLGSKTNPGSSKIVGSHAYALVGYNASTQMFTLYNPWGSTVQVTWSELQSSFSGWSDMAIS